MSTLTTAPATPTTPSTASPYQVTFPRVLRSEWIKFWTLRSTIWTIVSAIVVMAGFGFLTVFFTAQALTQNIGEDRGGPPAGILHDPSIILVGSIMAQLAVAVLGVLVITGEYSTGMIRSTLTAVPKRLPALWAKALVLTVVTTFTAVVAIAISWLVTLPTLRANDAALDLGNSETQRILLGGVLYLIGIALLSFAIGALLRHSAAALATVLGLLLVVENVFRGIPAAFFQNVSPFLPSTAGQQIISTQESIDRLRAAAAGTGRAVLDPWQGYGVMMLWVVVLLAVAAVLLRRRDA
ncbi:MAG: ABC transporter permease subunit [Cellulomonas sp.]